MLLFVVSKFLPYSLGETTQIRFLSQEPKFMWITSFRFRRGIFIKWWSLTLTWRCHGSHKFWILWKKPYLFWFNMTGSSTNFSTSSLGEIIYLFYFPVGQVFQANSDRHTIVTNIFPRSIVASHIRVHPQTWYSWVSMRIEFIGCPIGELLKTNIPYSPTRGLLSIA